MLLKNIRYLITQNAKREVLENKDVLIENSEIKGIGTNLTDDGEIIDCSEKIVMPGLINTHTHAAMNLYRGISDNKKLQDWLQEDIFPAEAKLEAQDVYYGSLLAIIEMLQTGTTCFNDMYFFADEIAKACEESGIRGRISRFVMDIDGEGEKRLKESKDFLESYKNNELIRPVVAPHSVYTCSKEYLEKVLKQARKHNAPIHIHISETETENKDCQEEYGKSPTEYLNELGLLGEKNIGAHGVWLSDKDIELLKKSGTGVAHCPCSNMKLGSGRASISKMSGINIGLGTDGAASNNNLNMFEEMKFASLLQKLNDSTQMSGQKVLDIATIEGAKALNIENNVGSIEEGKKADIIMIDLDEVSMTPRYGKKGVISNLVFSFNGKISDSIVNGEFALRDGEVPNIDVEKVRKEVQERVEKFSD